MIRRLSVALVLVFVVAACGSSGEPNGFDEQLVPVSQELSDALGTSAEFLPVIQRNFLEGCVLADTPRIDIGGNLARSCQCAYDGIVEFYRENSTGETPVIAEQAAFDAFKELDDALQTEGGVIPANIRSILDGCGT